MKFTIKFLYLTLLIGNLPVCIGSENVQHKLEQQSSLTLMQTIPILVEKDLSPEEELEQNLIESLSSLQLRMLLWQQKIDEETKTKEEEKALQKKPTQYRKKINTYYDSVLKMLRAYDEILYSELTLKKSNVHLNSSWLRVKKKCEETLFTFSIHWIMDEVNYLIKKIQFFSINNIQIILDDAEISYPWKHHTQQTDALLELTLCHEIMQWLHNAIEFPEQAPDERITGLRKALETLSNTMLTLINKMYSKVLTTQDYALVNPYIEITKNYEKLYNFFASIALATSRDFSKQRNELMDLVLKNDGLQVKITVIKHLPLVKKNSYVFENSCLLALTHGKNIFTNLDIRGKVNANKLANAPIPDHLQQVFNNTKESKSAVESARNLLLHSNHMTYDTPNKTIPHTLLDLSTRSSPLLHIPQEITTLDRLKKNPEHTEVFFINRRSKYWYTIVAHKKYSQITYYIADPYQAVDALEEEEFNMIKSEKKENTK